MAITNTFRNAVQAGNIRSIRIMMKDSLLVDPTFTEFQEMEAYARGVHGLYDLHDGRVLNEQDQSTWNDDYMNKLMVQVVGNFSHERISHLKKVVRYLRPVATSPQRTTSNSPYDAPLFRGSQGVPSSRGDSVRSTQGGSVRVQGGAARRTFGGKSYSSKIGSKQRGWINSRTRRIRNQRTVTGVVVGGVTGGTVSAVAGGSFLAGAAVGAIVVGATVYFISGRR